MDEQQWQFNSDIAKIFVDHARQHIPNYDQVIDKSVSLCQRLARLDSPIIDVGCATGETLQRLYTLGFYNLHGVDASQAMLDQCDPSLAKYYHDDKFPSGTFDAIICNWTLHFVKDKVRYLSGMFNGLDEQGFLILSEKTSLDPICIDYYHDYKRSKGVSESDIINKEKSVKDIMFIENPAWYMDTLKSVGFKRIEIIDAHWCFTTFFCRR